MIFLLLVRSASFYFPVRMTTLNSVRVLAYDGSFMNLYGPRASWVFESEIYSENIELHLRFEHLGPLVT